MKFRKNQLYKNCSDLPIYNFDKVLTTGNNLWLLRDYDGYKELKIDDEKAKKRWSKIYDEYCKITKDNKSLTYYRLIQEVGYLNMRKIIVGTILEQIVFRTKNEAVLDLFIKELQGWRFYINRSKDITSEIEKMYRQLRASGNKIKLIEDELKRLRESGGESISLVKQNVKLIQALDRNSIDTKQTTVEEWVAMLDEVKEITNSRKAKLNNR